MYQEDKKEIANPVKGRKAAAKKTAKKRGRPVKKKTVAKRSVSTVSKVQTKTKAVKKKLAKKKVAKKRAGRPPLQAEPVAKPTPRRGRPVSVEVLQRKLARAEEMLGKEKEKRVKQIDALKEKLAVTAAAKKELQQKLKTAVAELSRIHTEKKAADKLAAQQLKMEAARNEAVGKFLAKWEKSYLAAEKKKSGGKRRRRGRPRKS